MKTAARVAMRFMASKAEYFEDELQRRLEGILRNHEDEDFEVSTDDVHVPTELGTVRARLKRYLKAVDEANGLDLGLSIEDIGDAGSPMLREYEKAVEALPGYDELAVDEIYTDENDAADSIIESIEV